MNALTQEFIGKSVTISTAKNHSLEKLSGTIVDETKETFIILITSKEKKDVFKTVMKNGTTFIVGNDVIVGDDICRRPEDRIKHAVKHSR